MATVHQLVELFQIEEQARSCRSRAEAQRCIREADAAKRALWGTTEGSIAAHVI